MLHKNRKSFYSYIVSRNSMQMYIQSQCKKNDVNLAIVSECVWECVCVRASD